jgi:hypothetical protein
MMRLGIVGPLAAALLLAACSPGLPPAQNYATVFGRIYDAATNAPIAGAQVTVDVVAVAVTGSDGSYSVNNVPIGQTDVTVRPPAGYAPPPIEAFSVSAGERFRLDIPLNRAP